MKFQIMIAAGAALALSAGFGHAAPAKAAPGKGVKCGDSYIAAGKTCTKAPPAPVGKGVKCGDSYIAAGQVCHKTATVAPVKAAPAKTAMPAPAKPMMSAPAKMTAAPAKMTATAPTKTAMAAPMAVKAKGKKCGNAYIAATATCTKK